jgi:hypothetical protein
MAVADKILSSTQSKMLAAVLTAVLIAQALLLLHIHTKNLVSAVMLVAVGVLLLVFRVYEINCLVRGQCVWLAWVFVLLTVLGSAAQVALVLSPALRARLSQLTSGKAEDN